KSGRMTEAIEHLKQAIRIKPDFPEVRYNLGIALEQAGRVPEAVEQFEQALKLRPDFTPARSALTRLGATQ
ncbi:MAG: tetratricopeptide repeat protein, partial [Verrucomicrobiia bacterium]